MTLIRTIGTLMTGILLTTTCFGQGEKVAVEYLGIPRTISFDNITYTLAWSAHPSYNYYKQKYLPEGDTLEKFKKLVTIDVLVGKAKLKDIVNAKISELDKLKEANPVVNYQQFENGNEIILDFLLSENTPDGKHLTVVERNLYRYKYTVDKNGQKIVLLFAVSQRAYGDEIETFFANLSDQMYELIVAVGTIELPEISITKE